MTAIVSATTLRTPSSVNPFRIRAREPSVARPLPQANLFRHPIAVSHETPVVLMLNVPAGSRLAAVEEPHYVGIVVEDEQVLDVGLDEPA